MENNPTNAKSTPGPEPLKPPPQPLDIKKTGVRVVPLFVVVVLGFLLAALAFAFLSKAAQKKAAAQKKQQAQAVAKEQEPSLPAMEVAVPAPVEKPAVIEKEEEKPLPVLTLSGILLGEQGSMALINGRVVPEGGMVEGAKLERIYSDKVELSFEGKKIVLRSR